MAPGAAAVPPLERETPFNVLAGAMPKAPRTVEGEGDDILPDAASFLQDEPSLPARAGSQANRLPAASACSGVRFWPRIVNWGW